jgi:hypothetical protein
MFKKKLFFITKKMAQPRELGAFLRAYTRTTIQKVCEEIRTDDERPRVVVWIFKDDEWEMIPDDVVERLWVATKRKSGRSLCGFLLKDIFHLNATQYERVRESMSTLRATGPGIYKAKDGESYAVVINLQEAVDKKAQYAAAGSAALALGASALAAYQQKKINDMKKSQSGLKESTGHQPTQSLGIPPQSQAARATTDGLQDEQSAAQQEIAHLQRGHAKEIERLRGEQATAQQETAQETARLQEEQRQEIERLRGEQRQEIERLRGEQATAQQETAQETTRLQEEQRQEIERLRGEQATAEQETARLRGERAEETARLQEEQRQEIERLRGEQATAQQETAQETARLQEEQRQEIERLRGEQARAEQENARLRGEHAEETARLQEAQTREKGLQEGALARLQRELEAARQANASQIEALKTAHKEREEGLLQREVQEHAAALFALQTEEQALQARVATLQEELQAQIMALQAQKSQAEEASAELRQENEALRLETVRDRRSLQQTHTTEIQELQQTHTTEIQELREAHQKQIKRFEAELKSLQAQILKQSLQLTESAEKTRSASQDLQAGASTSPDNEKIQALTRQNAELTRQLSNLSDPSQCQDPVHKLGVPLQAAQQKAKQAEQQAKQAEQQAKQAEQQAKEVEQRQKANQQAEQANQHAERAKQQAEQQAKRAGQNEKQDKEKTEQQAKEVEQQQKAEQKAKQAEQAEQKQARQKLPHMSIKKYVTELNPLDQDNLPNLTKLTFKPEFKYDGAHLSEITSILSKHKKLQVVISFMYAICDDTFMAMVQSFSADDWKRLKFGYVVIQGLSKDGQGKAYEATITKLTDNSTLVYQILSNQTQSYVTLITRGFPDGFHLNIINITSQSLTPGAAGLVKNFKHFKSGTGTGEFKEFVTAEEITYQALAPDKNDTK